jgi:hypothetical protein
MPTLMQKIRLALKGWNRRREEREREFVARNVGWGGGGAGGLKAAAPQAPQAPSGAAGFSPPTNGFSPPASASPDLEGLAVAYLDDSGRIDYYLDTTTGEVIDVRDGSSLAAPRYRRVPARSEESEAADRGVFIGGLEDARKRAVLAPHAGSHEAFRKAVATDRSLERAWYSFKNERAIRAIEEWLRS